jgi:hypothetical protein
LFCAVAQLASPGAALFAFRRPNHPVRALSLAGSEEAAGCRLAGACVLSSE